MITKVYLIIFHPLRSIKSKLNQAMDYLYLRLSDCDGMCDHCEPYLKQLCHARKNKLSCQIDSKHEQ